MLYRSNRQNRSRGFTLFEMLVVVGIMVIVTGVVLANFPGFRNESNLDLVAQEVAVAIRQAQTYGIATREKGGTFDSYGVNFVNNNSTRFIIFADKSTSGTQNKYDSGELVEQFDFKGGIKLASNGLKFCGNSGCTDFAGNPQAGVNIMFYRPDPEATFKKTDGGNFVNVDTSVFSIFITNGKTGDENKREIIVHRSGHIYVKPQ